MKKAISKMLLLVLVLSAVCFFPTSTGIKASAYTEVDAEISAKDLDYVQYSDGTLGVTKYKGSSTSIVIPETIGGKSVAAVDGDLLGYDGEKDKITSVVLPKTVTYIGKNAFSNLKNLKTVTIKGKVTRIGDYAFNSCEALSSINLPEGLTEIGESAFYNCKSLTSVVLPSTLKKVGYTAFAYCPTLKTINIPSSLTEFGERCFSQTPWLEDRINDYSSHLVIKNNIIIDGAMYSGETLTIPSYVTAIADAAFQANQNIKKVVVPSNVKSIGYYAFNYCKNLSSVSVASGVSSIGSNAFTDTPWLTAQRKKNPLVIVSGIVIDGKSCSGDVVIPSTVTKIGENAFEINTNITSVTIPSSVKEICDMAFYGCSKLKTLKLSKGLVSIGNTAFESCTALTNITFPSTLKTIDAYAFCYCSSLQEIVIPSSVTSIGRLAFYYCTSVSKIVFPTTALTVGQDAFCRCAKVESLTVPKNLNIAGSGVFSSMVGLKTLKFEEGITKIFECEFTGCNSLESVELPKSLVKIGKQAFQFCNGLRYIYIPNNTVSIMYQAFDSCYGLKYANVHSNTKTIGEGAFASETFFEIRCNKGSAIDTFAQKNNIKVSYFSITTERLYGNTRYGTASSIAKAAYPNGTETVVIASGTQFADALAGVPLAYALNAPILLSTPAGLDNTTLDRIIELKPKKAYILGGKGAVPGNVMLQLSSLDIKVTRLAGDNRYETAVKIAQELAKHTTRTDGVYMVNGSSYPDALSVSPLAAMVGSPILYTKPDGTLDETTRKFLDDSHAFYCIDVIGGESIISNDTMKSLNKYVGTVGEVRRFAGANRYDTCIAVNNFGDNVYFRDAICVVTGKNFPDALAAGLYAAKHQIPLLLADDTLTANQKAYLQYKQPAKLIAIGGKGVVPNEMLTKISTVVKSAW